MQRDPVLGRTDDARHPRAVAFDIADRAVVGDVDAGGIDAAAKFRMRCFDTAVDHRHPHARTGSARGVDRGRVHLLQAGIAAVFGGFLSVDVGGGRGGGAGADETERRDKSAIGAATGRTADKPDKRAGGQDARPAQRPYPDV